MPGKISTLTSRFEVTRPAPLHAAHALFGTWPVPRHFSHARTCEKLPKKVLRFSLISPWPLHAAHVENPAFASTPCPLHVSHRTNVSIFKCFVTPRNASSSEISSTSSRSEPRSYVLRRGFTPNPSKNVSNMSPKSPILCGSTLKPNPSPRFGGMPP